MPRSINARSREKKSAKKATVERRVQSTRMNVKMNQPCDHVRKKSRVR